MWQPGCSRSLCPPRALTASDCQTVPPSRPSDSAPCSAITPFSFYISCSRHSNAFTIHCSRTTQITKEHAPAWVRLPLILLRSIVRISRAQASLSYLYYQSLEHACMCAHTPEDSGKGLSHAERLWHAGMSGSWPLMLTCMWGHACMHASREPSACMRAGEPA
jgi:hypothetical protein